MEFLREIILVVEDDNTTVDLLTMRLEHSGFEVLTANNGKDGLQKIREEKPDLVLLDVFMPEMNGFETCRLAKLDEDIKHIPIVLLTTASQKSQIEKGKEVGADGHIIKPYMGSGLVEQIKEYLKEKK